MRNGLGIGGDTIVFLGTEVYECRAEAGKDLLNEVEAGIG